MAHKVLLTGPAGCGKTHKLLTSFERALKQEDDSLNSRSFFVVPSAEHRERITTLLIQRGFSGVFLNRVTTLSALIQDLFKLKEFSFASVSTRIFILKEILAEKPRPYFHKVVDKPGFVKMLSSWILEMKQTGISPEYFRKRVTVLKKMEPGFAEKYEALASVFEAYEKRMQELGFYDPEDMLRVFKEEREKSNFSPKRLNHIWIDGFFDFTNLQYAYLEELLQWTDNLALSLTLDDARTESFPIIFGTLTRLQKMGFEVKKCAPMTHRTQKPELAHLSQNLFSEQLHVLKDEVSEVTLLDAVGVQGEIELIAGTLLKLLKQGSYKLSDCAIILRNVSSYEKVIRSVFRQFEIPVEIHERQRLSESAWISDVVSFLRIMREGWHRDDVFHFLKSAFVTRINGNSKNSRVIGTFEKESQKLGIVDGYENWLEHKSAFSEESWLIFEFLSNACDRVMKAEGITALSSEFEFVLKRSFGLFDVSEQDHEFSLRQRASEMNRFDVLMRQIRQYFDFESRQAFDFESFAEQFFKLVELDLYSHYERNKNQVQVYDVSLSRQKEYKVVFVAGLLEGDFPIQVKEDPFLSDWERMLFSHESEFPIAPKIERQTLEKYLFYLAVTRAKDNLYLSYPRLNHEGKEALPSFYLEEVQSLFEQDLPVVKQNLAMPYSTIQGAATMKQMEEAVVGAAHDRRAQISESHEALLSSVFLYLSQSLGFKERFALSQMRVDADLASPEALGESIMTPTIPSPTRLEEYGKCHFRYFASRILNLEDPEDNIRVMLKGTILHEVFEFFFAWYKTQKNQSEESIRKKIDELLNQAIEKHVLFYDYIYRQSLDNAELRDMAHDFIFSELDYLKKAVLQPEYFEFAFGGQGEKNTEAYDVEVDGRQIMFQGKVDRVDMDPDQRYALILDYKRSKSFKKSDLELGTALQLPLYLAAIEKMHGAKAVGGELVSIKDKRHSGFYYGGKDFDAYGKKGMSGDEFRGIQVKALKYAKKYLDEMDEHNIAVEPRECMKKCSYHSVCRFEKWKETMLVQEHKAKDLEYFKETSTV